MYAHMQTPASAIMTGDLVSPLSKRNRLGCWWRPREGQGKGSPEHQRGSGVHVIRLDKIDPKIYLWPVKINCDQLRTMQGSSEKSIHKWAAEHSTSHGALLAKMHCFAYGNE